MSESPLPNLFKAQIVQMDCLVGKKWCSSVQSEYKYTAFTPVVIIYSTHRILTTFVFQKVKMIRKVGKISQNNKVVFHLVEDELRLKLLW